LIQLLESVRGLDADLEPEAMAALAWFIMRLHTSDEVGLEDEIALGGVGLLSLAIESRNTVQDADILQFTEWLLAQDRRARDAWGVWGEGFAGDFDRLLRTRISCACKSGSRWPLSWRRSTPPDRAETPCVRLAGG